MYATHIQAFNDEIIENLDTMLIDFTRWELPEDKATLLDLTWCNPDYDQRLMHFARDYPYLADTFIQEEYIQAEAVDLAKWLLKMEAELCQVNE